VTTLLHSPQGHGQPAGPPFPGQAAAAARPARPVRRVAVAITMTIVIVALTGLMVGIRLARQPDGGARFVLGWPGMQYVVYAAWMMPLAELALLAAGQWHYRHRFRRAPAGTYQGLIIQITTTGREQDRVNEVISQLHGYRLSMMHEIWVVTEPSQGDNYPLADLVLAVPAEFRARSERKARALEFSRQVRARAGLDRADIKILFNDDDVAPTRDYIETAFIADYDVCEGITAPRSEYAVRPLGHFLASHADDLRTYGCLVYCSVFQGILGRPLHVHGEGLTVTGAAERVVTWNWPAFASEDLIFGHKAARAGLRWGWFHHYAELTSPWTLADFLIQRRRWLWGDLHGMARREMLTLPAAAAVLAKYLLSLLTIIFSLAGLYLRFTGQLPHSGMPADVARLAIIAWLAIVFACGWIGASSRVHGGRTEDARLLSGVLAVLALPVTTAMTLIGIFVPLLQGSPHTFQVIRKTQGGTR
jgi:Glycosyl transferase family group 2